MAHSEAVIAAGFGCRAGCPVEHVLAVLEQALAAAGCRLHEVRALYTADFKHSEAGLLRAAELLNKPLIALPVADLQAQSAQALSCSAHTLERFGVPSVAETAALAGASVSGRNAPGDRPRLLGPRRTSGSATCALASSGRSTEHGP
ncbi:MAG: cobalamin biosynthesis protein [Deltaproteobacteria bacterium]